MATPASEAAPAAAGPLAGFTVLDLSTMMAGPYCGRWLADLGARVIKVEAPEGDYMRGRPPLRDGCSAYFGVLNAGKHSVVLDLKTADGVAALHALAAEADVLLEGFRPGVTRRLGVDYAALAPHCPRLVYCSISGYGQDGPRALLPAYAPVIHAECGYDKALLACQDVQDRPANSPIPVGDAVTAIFATVAIQAALLQRERTGRGQQVDVSLLESMLTLMPFELTQAQFANEVPRAVFKPVLAKDDFLMVAPVTPKNFLDLCTAIGQPGLSDDPAFKTALARVHNWDLLLAHLARWTADKPAQECVRLLREAGVPCAVYGQVEDALHDEQLNHRGYFATSHDAAGAFQLASLPFRMSGADNRPAGWVATLGEHTTHVLDSLGDSPPRALNR
ncbi:MAG: CoA transferase [Burkholderiales bacterium]